MPGADRSPLFRLLRDYAWRHRWSYLGGAGFLWLTNYLAVSIPAQIGEAIDALRSGVPVGRFVAVIAAMGMAIVGVRTLSRILIFNPARDLEYHFRKDLFAHLLRLPPAFFARHRSGDLISRAANDIGWVRVMVGFGGLQVLNVTFALVLTSWKMIDLSPRLTILAALPIAAGVTATQWSIRRLLTLHLRNQRELGDLSDHVLGSLQGIGTIRGFVAERAFMERFRKRNRAWLRTGMRIALLRSLAMPILVLSGGLAVCVLLVIGGPMVAEGKLTIGQLAAFIALLTVLLPPLRSLGWLLSVVQRGRAALERLEELTREPEQASAGGAVGSVPGVGPEVAIENLQFAYSDRTQDKVLKGITATIPAGAIVGIYGPTGSGKTSLLRLLARLEEVEPGMIRVDGVDLTQVELGAWRERVAMAPQRPFLFSETIPFNIALEDEADAGRVRAAVRAAALERDIESLPEGLETVVGERGIMLSGGQRQRVSLARVLYHGGDLVLLDDVLSAVDQETEADLVESLRSLVRSPRRPTVVIVSNRLSVLQVTEKILVLDHGRLVDTGTHQQLIGRKGPYLDAWKAQQDGGRALQGAAAS